MLFVKLTLFSCNNCLEFFIGQFLICDHFVCYPCLQEEWFYQPKFHYFAYLHSGLYSCVFNIVPIVVIIHNCESSRCYLPLLVLYALNWCWQMHHAAFCKVNIHLDLQKKYFNGKFLDLTFRAHKNLIRSYSLTLWSNLHQLISKLKIWILNGLHLIFKTKVFRSKIFT